MKIVGDDYVGDKNALRFRDVLLLLASVSPLVLGLFIIGWQILGYLKSGHWISVSIVDGLVWLKIKWASNPEDWIGLFKIMDQMHIFVGLALLSTVAALIVND